MVNIIKKVESIVNNRLYNLVFATFGSIVYFLDVFIFGKFYNLLAFLAFLYLFYKSYFKQLLNINKIEILYLKYIIKKDLMFMFLFLISIINNIIT